MYYYITLFEYGDLYENCSIDVFKSFAKTTLKIKRKKQVDLLNLNVIISNYNSFKTLNMTKIPILEFCI